MVTVNLHCPRCQSVQVYHHGKNPKGHDQFRCRDCHQVFQLTYCYEARKAGVKDQITEMAFNGAGVRDTARTLKISINNVIRTLKKISPRRITSSPVAHAYVALICEPDSNGVLSAVKCASTGSGTRTTRKLVALVYTFGPRTDETCCELLALLAPFTIGMLTTDEWGSYTRELPKKKHLAGKIFTQRIDRNNLTLRTGIKHLALRTICFSRSVELHEKVIGAFIEKYMFC
ncbi:TPA: IS1 family transposase [Escherichia coli]